MGECSCNSTPTTPRFAAATEPLDAPFPVPAYPPAEWFTEKPSWLTPDTKLAVDDEGRVAGYFYHHGQCLVHDGSACPRPSPTGYAAFHQSEIVTDSGDPLVVGVIGNVNGHADPYASVVDALAHYSDPDRQMLVVRAYDDDVGGVMLGSVIPRIGPDRRPINYGDVAFLRRCPTSGDWRPMGDAWWRAFGIQASVVRDCEGFDCIGPTLVTRPALPLVRRFAGDGGRVAAILGGMGGIQLDEQERHMEPNANASTVIDLGNGITVTAQGGNINPAAPGPHPVATPAAAVLAAADGAMTAAPAPGEGESDDDQGSEDDRVAALEERVATIEEVLRQVLDAIGAQPAQAASVLPPASE